MNLSDQVEIVRNIFKDERRSFDVEILFDVSVVGLEILRHHLPEDDRLRGFVWVFRRGDIYDVKVFANYENRVEALESILKCADEDASFQIRSYTCDVPDYVTAYPPHHAGR